MKLILYKGDNLEHVREVTVKMHPASEGPKIDPAILERNAYEMMDAAAAAILNDNGFKVCQQ